MTGLAAMLPDAGLLDRGLEWRRAWPDDAGVVLELEGADGSVVGGRWRPGEARVKILEPAGDPQLPGLAALLADGGCVVGYRAGRRAVVRVADGFVKVLRPGRSAAIVARHCAVAAAASGQTGGPVVPELVAADRDQATMQFAALPGIALPVLLATATPTEAATLGARLGSVLAVWWAAPPPAGLPAHDAAAERSVLTSWHARALAARVVTGGTAAEWSALVARALTGLDELSGGGGRLIHRDLHAGQILVGADGAIGLLDLDTASTGDPALDLGNLLAHLDLEVVAGRCSAGTASTFRAALLEGVLAAGMLAGRAVAVYQRASLARLVAVHAFRPGAAVLVPALLRHADVMDATARRTPLGLKAKANYATMME